MDLEELQEKISAGDWRAVELAGKIGASAWLVIKKAAESSYYKSRQIAMSCAGCIGGEESGPVLSSGISDTNINVRLAAAKALSVNPPLSAADAICEVLSSSKEKELLIFLALAAGYLPGKSIVGALQNLLKKNDVSAQYACMALAKLGDRSALRHIKANLDSPNPRIRYEALVQIKYVDDSSLAIGVKKFLIDCAEAFQIGPSRNPTYRRVCDQAVDTLVSLLNLSPKFKICPEKRYSDAELRDAMSW